MEYDAIRMVIKRLAAKAGIKKRVYNHLYRHSRATELANHLTQAQMEAHLGWIHGSDMPGVYIHLSGQQVDDAILGMYGINKEEERNPLLTPIKCVRCNHVNSPTSDFCSLCGMALNTEAATNVDQMVQLGIKAVMKIAAMHPKESGEVMVCLENLLEEDEKKK
ncbi:hypothetical protein [uncultured Methanomethylovorans sp.]|uniref:hypothetical protein n=1 Tax=uncultured Methanomethylovorans sp. TaxID=183759 RepID=UPI002AA7D7B1|nr:hypothetical protein [uncultured Methanomethylovorans sp.]